MPPTRKAPAGVSTCTANSFGPRSVVMMPRAALCPSRLSAAKAAVAPVTTLSTGRCTPMTPVEETSTCSTGQPTRSATDGDRRPRRRQALGAGAGVGAAAVDDRPRGPSPPLAATCSRETRTGAACTWLVVKTAATDAGRSATMSVTSSAPDALMPAATPAAREPFGGGDAAGNLGHAHARGPRSASCRRTASCPHRRNSEQPAQSCAIFSGSHACGTSE